MQRIRLRSRHSFAAAIFWISSVLLSAGLASAAGSGAYGAQASEAAVSGVAFGEGASGEGASGAGASGAGASGERASGAGIVALNSPWAPTCPNVDDYAADVHDFPPDVAVDSPLDIRDGCPRWRWLALQADTESPCPEPPPTAAGSRWRVRSLFVDADELPALRPFCLYETRNPNAIERGRLNDSLGGLLGTELTEIQSGCGAVTPTASAAADSYSDASWAVMETRHDEHTLPLPALTVETPAGEVQLSEWPRVRLTFIDTQPTGLGETGSSHHGKALARIAQRLVCQGGDERYCAAQIEAELGLPILELDADDPIATEFSFDRGGHFGTIDQLAQAVWKALQSWEQSKQEHLVLNLSVGWSGELFGGLGDDVNAWPIAVRSLYQALRVASCRGAMVLAAAGNKIGGPQEENGPLLPGGWERLAAPSPRECRTSILPRTDGHLDQEERSFRRFWERCRICGLFHRDNRHGDESSRDTCTLPTEPASEREPLLYAVGGVHADDVGLVNGRPHAEPARVAYGDHALVRDIRPGGLPAVLTGSSTATAVVSSAAAAVWHFRPELTRREVMDLVEASGRPLDRTADVYLGSKPPPVRRIAVCPAVSAALRAGCGDDDRNLCRQTCPQVECPTLPTGNPAPLQLADSCIEGPTRIVNVGRHEFLDENPFCERLALNAPVDSQPLHPCPFRQFWGVCARPWGCPQPQGNPCPTCDLGGGGGGAPLTAATSRKAQPASQGLKLRIQIDPEWSEEIQSAVLGIGNTRLALDIDIDFETEQPRCVIVEGIDPALLEPVDGVRPTTTVYFLTSEGSVESPIYFGR